MRRLVLWDIDGTLIRGDTTVGQCFAQAVREIYRLPEATRRIQYSGKTDPQIVIETLMLHDIGEVVALQHLAHFNDRYCELLHAVRHALPYALIVLPGVETVLQQVHAAGALQTVLTGNIAPVAALKLEATGLHRFIDLAIGAYGSDHRDRTKLVPIAQRRAGMYSADTLRTVVIGDTPADIACGRAGGARTVAVATGASTLDELQASAPDALLADLSDTQAALAAILEGTTNDHRR